MIIKNIFLLTILVSWSQGQVIEDDANDNIARLIPTNANIARLSPAEDNIARLIPAEENIARLIPADVNIARLTPAEDNIARLTPNEDNIARMMPADVNTARLIPADVNIARLVTTDDTDDIDFAPLIQDDENSNESEELLFDEDEDTDDYSDLKENDVPAVKLVNEPPCRGCRRGRRHRFQRLRQRRNGSRHHAGKTFEAENDFEDDLEEDAAVNRVHSDVFEVPTGPKDDTKAVKLLKQKKRCRGRICKKLKKLQRLRNRETAVGRERYEEIQDQDDSEDVTRMQLQRHRGRGRKRHHKRIRQNRYRVPRCGKFSRICCDRSTPSFDRTCADGSKFKCSLEECKNRFS